MMFDGKIEFDQKVSHVTGGHMKGVLAIVICTSFMSKETMLIVFTASLNALNIMAAVILIANITTPKKEMIQTTICHKIENNK